MIVYRLLSRLFPAQPFTGTPRRILLVLPCCIGDVILATATLQALRRAYPAAHITWAVGQWSRGVLQGHDLLNALLDTGPGALPLKSPREFLGFVRQMRAGHYDLLVSLVRSPLMSAAALLSGIPQRAGLDSAGRGFGYTVRASVDPQQPRHEAEIYLDVARALGLDVHGCRANVPVHSADAAAAREVLQVAGIGERYIMLNPAGGQNPGMTLTAKRWPPGHFAALGARLAAALDAQLVLVGGPGDGALLDAVSRDLTLPHAVLAGKLSFGQLAAAAAGARVYVGNDTGMTHLAAAAGARTVMILGPSDPARYAPFAPDALTLWKPTAVQRAGVAAGVPQDWDWGRDGIGVDEAAERIQGFLGITIP